MSRPVCLVCDYCRVLFLSSDRPLAVSVVELDSGRLVARAACSDCSRDLGVIG
jgi:hypothetical protein